MTPMPRARERYKSEFARSIKFPFRVIKQKALFYTCSEFHHLFMKTSLVITNTNEQISALSSGYRYVCALHWEMEIVICMHGRKVINTSRMAQKLCCTNLTEHRGKPHDS